MISRLLPVLAAVAMIPAPLVALPVFDAASAIASASQRRRELSQLARVEQPAYGDEDDPPGDEAVGGCRRLRRAVEVSAQCCAADANCLGDLRE